MLAAVASLELLSKLMASTHLPIENQLKITSRSKVNLSKTAHNASYKFRLISSRLTCVVGRIGYDMAGIKSTWNPNEGFIYVYLLVEK